jgi:hypothetical protein
MDLGRRVKPTGEPHSAAKLRSKRRDGVNDKRGGGRFKRLNLPGSQSEDPQGPRETERANGENGSHTRSRSEKLCL